MRESRRVKSYTDFQKAEFGLVRGYRLIADHFRIFAQNQHPHDFKLIVEPELPRPGVALQFEFDQIPLPAFNGDFFAAEELGG